MNVASPVTLPSFLLESSKVASLNTIPDTLLIELSLNIAPVTAPVFELLSLNTTGVLVYISPSLIELSLNSTVPPDIPYVGLSSGVFSSLKLGVLIYNNYSNITIF